MIWCAQLKKKISEETEKIRNEVKESVGPTDGELKKTVEEYVAAP